MRHNLWLGVILSLLGALCYATQAALVKAQASEIPLSMLVCSQSILALILLMPILFRNGATIAIQKVKTKRFHLHFLRAMASLGLNFLLFASVKHIALVDTMLLANTTPLIVPFMAYFMLSQKINHRLWLPILIGFIGVAIVLRPDTGIFQLGSFLALGIAVGMSMTMLLVRKLSATDSPITTTFYVFFLTALVAGIASAFDWAPINSAMLVAMGWVGLTYFLVQIFLTTALQNANPQLVSALLFSSNIFAVFIQVIIWHNIPSISTDIGMALTIVGGILCIREEHIQIQRQKIKPHSVIANKDEALSI